MGGFFYASKQALPDLHDVLAKSREQFRHSGFGKSVTFESDSCIIDYYPKIDYPSCDHVDFGDGNFIFAVGTFVYGNQIGADALKLLYDQANHLEELRASHGHFLIVLRKGGRTILFKDPIGSYDLFLTRNDHCATTSFLAAAEAAGRSTINVQETYEYVFNGVSLGTATPLAEVRRLGLSERMIFEPGPAIISQDIAPSTEEAPESFSTLVDRNLAGLLEYATTLIKLFGDNIKIALSGGYDSRLLLAMFRHAGVTPRLFVYGGDKDQDVRTAKRITEAEGIALDHIDKPSLRGITPETYPEIVQNNFFREDALPNGGIFTNGAELIARSRRSENGALHVNGGGGEVFRNFFNLPAHRSLTPRQFVWVFYSRFDPEQCTGAFVPKAFEERIADKVAAVFASNGAKLSRRQVESLYPYFRCRSWFGRENSINSRWGYSILPFFDHQTVTSALRIPIRYKYFGNFEACLIRRADPALARYESNYGHSFAQDAPLGTAIADVATYLRPAWLRRHMFRLKSHLGKRRNRPDQLSERYLARVIDTSFPFMSRYFKLDKVTSDLHFARICTLEYLFGRVSAR